MAGAVSAGAYTAGVVDYLLEVLRSWEEMKNMQSEATEDQGTDIPNHRVQIDVISGASAGGITASLMLLRSYLSDNEQLIKNTWLNLSDSDTDTLQQLLDTGDLSEKGLPNSLLNSCPIENLAESVFKPRALQTAAPYISSDIDVILTTTNLRGLNFKVDFQGPANPTAAHIITHHGGFFRYRVTTDSSERGLPSDKNKLWYTLDLSYAEDLQNLKEATLSTAAFPVGLRSRKMQVPRTYIERLPDHLFKSGDGISLKLDEKEDPYRFTSIDGGLINNEPYGIGLKTLKEKHPDIEKNDTYAVIMIDPFPQKEEATEPLKNSHIFAVAKAMFKTLRNQVMFNQEGILEALKLKDRTRFLIAPAGENKQEENPLASAPLNGFAGFIDRSFRKHDYELGRKNCQDFLRYHLVIPLKDCEKRLGFHPSEAMIDRFAVGIPKGDRNNLYFPVIPDVMVKTAFTGKAYSEKYGEHANLKYPEFPQFNAQLFLRKYRRPIKKRVLYLVHRSTNNWALTALYYIFFQRKTLRRLMHIISESTGKKQEETDN